MSRLTVATLVLVIAPAILAATSPPQKFETPEQASQALLDAVERVDIAKLTTVLGSDGVDLVITSDKVQSENVLRAFAAQARVKHAVALDPKKSKVAVLTVGPDDWPSPIPIVKSGSTWSFDSKAGRKEILQRRIGGNELDAIEVCRGFVEAQHAYALEKHDGSTVNQYAQRIVSSPGKHDGLAWKAADGTWEGPVGEGIARVIAEGYSSKYEPYHGYFFKVLKGQGPSAQLGAMDFVVRGAMIGGFALAAAPAEYGATGIKTFIVSHDGVVYEKDLGAKTVEVFQAMERFDPDRSWTPVTASW